MVIIDKTYDTLVDGGRWRDMVILSYLNRHKGVASLSEMAKVFEMPRPTIQKVVTRLKKSGLYTPPYTPPHTEKQLQRLDFKEDTKQPYTPPHTVAYTPEEQEKYNKYVKFNEWLKSSRPNVAKMKNQLTFEQFNALFAKYDKMTVFRIIEKMNNELTLCKKNLYVYYTACNWISRGIKNGWD